MERFATLQKKLRHPGARRVPLAEMDEFLYIQLHHCNNQTAGLNPTELTMIRLFIAIDIPENIRREIQGMGRSIANARPVPEDQLHLTLKFIGEIENSRLPDICLALNGITQRQFSLCLRGVGTFPPRGTPRVLWAGVAPAANTVSLRNSIERTLSDIGIPRGKKKYTPHVTLARLRNSPVHQLQQFLAGNALFHSTDFTVENFLLYSSWLSSKGAIHTVEATYPLLPDNF